MARPTQAELEAKVRATLAAFTAQLEHPLVVAARAGDLDAIAVLAPETDADYRGLALEEAARVHARASVEALLPTTAVSGAALQFAVGGPPELLERLLATGPTPDALHDALATALFDDRPEVVDRLIAAGLPREDAVATTRRIGSDAMRVHLGLPKRRERR